MQTRTLIAVGRVYCDHIINISLHHSRGGGQSVLRGKRGREADKQGRHSDPTRCQQGSKEQDTRGCAGGLPLPIRLLIGGEERSQ